MHSSKPLKMANLDMKLQGWRLTFELCCAGVDVHPFLAFSTTHQETGHRLTWKKCVGLCNLTTKRESGKESANILGEIKQTEKLKRGSIMTKIVYCVLSCLLKIHLNT